MTEYAELEQYYESRLLALVNETGSGYVVWCVRGAGTGPLRHSSLPCPHPLVTRQEIFDNGIHVRPDTVIHVWKGGWQPEMQAVTQAGLRAILSTPWYLNYISCAWQPRSCSRQAADVLPRCLLGGCRRGGLGQVLRRGAPCIQRHAGAGGAGHGRGGVRVGGVHRRHQHCLPHVPARGGGPCTPTSTPTPARSPTDFTHSTRAPPPLHPPPFPSAPRRCFPCHR